MVSKVGELTPEYFNYTFTPGIELPFPKLSRCLGGLRKGELTMISSGSGMGKSVFCNNLVFDFVKNKNLKVADISLESSQRKSIYRYAAMLYEVHPRTLREQPELMDDEKRQLYINTFHDLYIHDHFGSLQSNKLLKTLENYAYIEEVDFIFLDHISIAISGLESSREGERKDIDKLVTKMRELINNSGVGIICVSHLKNPSGDVPGWESGRAVSRYDLRGSGSLAQISDNIIAIEGELTNPNKKNERVLKLIKAREGDEQEVYCDRFTYDVNSGRIHLKQTQEVI